MAAGKVLVLLLLLLPVPLYGFSMIYGFFMIFHPFFPGLRCRSG